MLLVHLCAPDVLQFSLFSPLQMIDLQSTGASGANSCTAIREKFSLSLLNILLLSPLINCKTTTAAAANTHCCSRSIGKCQSAKREGRQTGEGTGGGDVGSHLSEGVRERERERQMRIKVQGKKEQHLNRR